MDTTTLMLLALSRAHMDRAEMFRADGLERAAALHFQAAEHASDLVNVMAEIEATEAPIFGRPITREVRPGVDRVFVT